MSRVATILLLACALATAACQRSVHAGGPGGSGSVQAGCGVAVIVPENAYNRARSAPFGPACGNNEVRVRVNGRCLGGTANTFTVNPGKHTLSVVYIDRAPRLNGRMVGTRAIALPLDAEAGHTYAIRGRTTWAADGTPTVSLWAVDGSTRQTVSSAIVPRADTLILGEADWWPDDMD